MTPEALSVDVRTSGIWQTNSAVLSSAGQVVVVDPAFFPRELDELGALVRSRGAEVTVVFTHGHWDHVAGWRHFPGARVAASPALVAAVAEGSADAGHNLGRLREFDDRWYVPRPAAAEWPPRLAALRDGERLQLGATAVEALELLGHSRDGLGLWLPQTGLLLPGDHLSPCEIPFVEDLHAYRATLERLRGLVSRATHVLPGHGPQLERRQAEAIAEADLAYLDALADCAARGDAEAALALPLPRAAGVPGMAEAHRTNCAAAGLGVAAGPRA